MALRITPPGEDPTKGIRGLPVSFSQPGTPPGEDAVHDTRELENQALEQAYQRDGVDDERLNADEIDFLQMVREAEQQAQLYMAQVNRRAWAQSYRALHQEHFIGSKYTRPEWRNRSRIFVPKTRTAVRKDLAAVAASLFNSLDAVTLVPGNDGDPKQRASAAVWQQVVNYRTTRTSGKAAFPWFLVALGARMDADVAGICMSKQCWKQEFRKDRAETFTHPETGERMKRDVYVLEVDRPDMRNFPPECFVIHSGADWLDPAQSAAFVILKYPMTVDEVKQKMDAPIKPWNRLSDAEIRSAANIGKQDMEAIRRARESGLDRMDETQTGNEFQVVWVYETFIRTAGEDWQFWSIGDKHYLTDPVPTREAYPEQFGERPIAFGYGALESHRIFPMSPVESWQQLQVETNDLRNLQLDAIKQNVMPVTKIVRGKRVDLDQVRRRSSGTSIFVDDPNDVTFEQPPQMGEAPILMSRELGLEFDDLSGQQNYGTVEDNNAVGRTLGGLKLAAGAANAVQEFDIRVWLETWAQSAMAQIVRLEQYYESDAKILALAGQKAKLAEKYGINQIDDELLEQEVTVRVSIGLGAGDPQQRLAKFQTATSVVAPIFAQTKEFQSGQVEVNWEEMANEVYGAVGYQDGGMRFFKVNPNPPPNPMGDLQTQKLQAEIAQRDRQGRAALLTGLANVAKVALGRKELEADVVDMLLGHQNQAIDRAHQHADMRHKNILAAADHGNRHGMAINEHRRGLANDAHQRAMAQQEQQNGEGAETEGAAPNGGPPSPGAPSPQQGPASSPPQIEFVRHPQTGRIIGARMHGGPQGQQQEGGASDERLSRLEQAVKEIGEHVKKPRKRNVVRDEQGRVTGVEDVSS